MAQAEPRPYALRFDVEFPDRNLDRLTSFFRIFVIIPIAIVLSLVSGGNTTWTSPGGTTTTIGVAGGLLFLAPLLLILFRNKYPRWWFDWNLELLRFSNRVVAYLLLLRDEYPSTDEAQAVSLDIDYPDVPNELMRGMPLVKWFLAIPHYIVLLFLSIALFFVAIIAWFAILFTGRYPRALFDYAVGVMRWYNRVVAYAFLLVTDAYPPFSLSA